LFVIPPLLAIAISVVYYMTSPRGAPIARRLFASAHGVIIAVLYVGAISIWLSGNSRRELGTPFLLLLLVPFASIIASFFLFRGPKLIHLLQLVNILLLLWTGVIGGIAVAVGGFDWRGP
jgi:hypothetical protein